MTVLRTSDGLALDARWDRVPEAVGAVVLCHPHPLHGGTMNAPLLVAVARVLNAHRLDVLRFDFRGVGRSEGTHGGGIAELADIDAAVAEAESTDLPLGLAGWSFGAATALRWEADRARGLPYVGIAPPVRSPATPPLPDPERLPPAPRSFVLGARDQFVAVAELEAYASSIGAAVHLLPGSDHFFLFREERVGELVAADLLDAFSAGSEAAVPGLG